MGYISVSGSSGTVHAEDLLQIAEAFGKVLEEYGFDGAFTTNVTDQGASISGSFNKSGPAGKVAPTPAPEVIPRVRAKFRVDSVTDFGDQVTVRLHPVTSSDPNSENHRFWKYTPNGVIELGTVNRQVADVLKPKREVYVDFTPAEG